MGSRHSTRLGSLSRKSMNSAVVPRRYLRRCDFDISPLFVLPFLDPPCRHLRRPPLLLSVLHPHNLLYPVDELLIRHHSASSPNDYASQLDVSPPLVQSTTSLARLG